MNLPEHILDTALQRLRTGESVLDIAKAYPEHQKELTEVLSLTAELTAFTKLPVPTPRKQFKYAEKAFSLSNFLSQFSFNMRFAAIPLSFLMVLVGGRFMLNATENSLPGDKLYAVKRATEVARINLTQDQEKLAILHLQLTQKRLEELKQAMHTNDQESSNAAAIALKEQTVKALETVPVVAEENAINNNDQTLLQDLVAINNEQKTLLSEISSEDNADIALSILTTTQTADESIAKLLAKVTETSEEVATKEPVKTDAIISPVNNTSATITPILAPADKIGAISNQPAEEPMASVIAEPIEPQFKE